VFVSRAPGPALRPFVQRFWASAAAAPPRVGAREHVLPTGLAQLVLRLSPEPILIFEGGEPRSLGHAVLGGARSSYYEKDISAPSIAVGATLLPGAASLFQVGADALAERHTRLDELWGPEVELLREQLDALRSPAARIDALEASLLRRLSYARPLHAAVAGALARLRAGEARIGALVEASGYSHRTLLVAFRSAVGLSPKTFADVLRFQHVLSSLAANSQGSLVEAALRHGYSDQAHLTRAFARIAGVSPGRYRSLDLEHSNHVPLAPLRTARCARPAAPGADVKYVQDGPRIGGHARGVGGNTR
jgi:AraC-like DNA-binding protein